MPCRWGTNACIDQYVNVDMILSEGKCCPSWRHHRVSKQSVVFHDKLAATTKFEKTSVWKLSTFTPRVSVRRLPPTFVVFALCSIFASLRTQSQALKDYCCMGRNKLDFPCSPSSGAGVSLNQSSSTGAFDVHVHCTCLNGILDVSFRHSPQSSITI